MGKHWVMGLGVVAAIAVCGACFAGSLPELTVKTSRVVIYKDGYCMFVKEVTGSVDASGKAVIRKVPDAMALGTFWLTTEAGASVASVASQETVVRKGQSEVRRTIEVTMPKGTPPGPVKLQLQHFGPGVRWIPTYRIALGKDGMAQMLMQAELLNESEDLRDAEVELVVGVPNFRFKDVPSAMTLEGSLRNFLLQVAPALMGQSMSNALFSQRAGEFRGDMGVPAPAVTAPGVPAIPGMLVGEGAQDLFTYHLPGLSLDVGERGAVPVFSGKVPFRHLYTWDVHMGRTSAESLPGVGAHASPVKLLKNEVWHLVELTNTTAVPWTTGTGFFMDGWLPVGQELLTYTSVGGKCQIPMTVAVDVRGTFGEEETGRELKAMRYNDSDYTRVTKKAALHVTNYKKEAVTLIVTCSLGGNVSKASDDGKITVGDYTRVDWSSDRAYETYSPGLNGHSDISWEFTLDAGKTKDLTCDYVFYVR